MKTRRSGLITTSLRYAKKLTFREGFHRVFVVSAMSCGVEVLYGRQLLLWVYKNEFSFLAE